MAHTLLARAMTLGGIALGDEKPAAQVEPLSWCHVQVAATSLGGLAGLQAYHTSLLVNDIEYYFCASGVRKAMGPHSHTSVGGGSGGATAIIDIGVFAVNMKAFERELKNYFRPLTYDLLRKNCNTFTNCGLQFLTGGRLEQKYRFIDSLGLAADRALGLVQTLSGGGYRPNPRADDFCEDETLAKLGRRVWV